jgi:hypothetical protein
MATIDEYLAAVAADKRAVLQALRVQIRRAAPDAVEAMSYGRPAFRLDVPGTPRGGWRSKQARSTNSPSSTTV